MSTNAVCGVAFATAVAVALTGACVPGSIAPRRGGAAGAAGHAAGDEITVVRDGAMSRDGIDSGASPMPPGSGGVGGRGVDAGAADGPTEMPKLPASDAARKATEDAAADTRRVDATARDLASDAPVARSPRVGELVIDELLINPAGDDLGREWIEIANMGGDWLDLSGLYLANASVDVGVGVAVGAGLVAPGGLRVLGQSADPAKNGGASVDVAYGTKLILNNADGRVSICVGACASGAVLDTVSWGTLGDAYTGHALVIDPATKAICPASAPFGTGASFGTPGAPNPPCAEGADANPTSDIADIADVSVAD